jgi:hypothetical protein
MTASLPLSPLAPAGYATHEHGWIAESRHPTSDGVIVYVRCVGCGTRRVDLIAPCGPVPTAVSRTAPPSPAS